MADTAELSEIMQRAMERVSRGDGDSEARVTDLLIIHELSGVLYQQAWDAMTSVTA
jgi:hypothetical protein